MNNLTEKEREIIEEMNIGESTAVTIAEEEGLSIEELSESILDGSLVIYEGFNLYELTREFVKNGTFGDVCDTLIRFIDFESMEEELEFEGYKEIDDKFVYVFV